MDANLEALSQQLAALTERFADLGAKLAEAARALQDTGAPPSDALVDDLAAAREGFLALRADVQDLAEVMSLPPVAGAESLRALEPVLTAVADAIRAEARRAALEKARAAVLAVLDHVLDLAHRDDRAFAPLFACQAQARDLRAAVEALANPESEQVGLLTDRITAFSDFLTIVETRDVLDDDRYERLEASVVKAFGRPLAVAAARGRLCSSADVEDLPPPEPEPEHAPEPFSAATAEPEVEPEPVLEPTPVAGPEAVLEPVPDEEPEAVLEPVPDEEPEAVLEPVPVAEPEAVAEPEPEAPSFAAAERAAATLQAAPPAPVAAAPEAPEPSGPDESAQWWLAAWARWSGWKSSLGFADAVREELSKYPYLLSVPIQQSPDYEDGLAAYGYSILMDHVEKHSPGCVGNALNSLDPAQRRPVGEQLYDYMIAEGRVAETYAEFVQNVVLNALPEPGLWFQSRILESKEDTRILQRSSARLGDTELSGKRLSSDSQRYAEHAFTLPLAPLTTRFLLVSGDLKESRGVGVKVVADGVPVDSAWLVTLPKAGKANAKVEARRVATEGTGLPGLGKDFSALWIAVFNDDPRTERRYEVTVTLRKDGRAPFGARRSG